MVGSYIKCEMWSRIRLCSSCIIDIRQSFTFLSCNEWRENNKQINLPIHCQMPPLPHVVTILPKPYLSFFLLFQKFLITFSTVHKLLKMNYRTQIAQDDGSTKSYEFCSITYMHIERTSCNINLREQNIIQFSL